MGGAAPSHGILGMQPELKDYVSTEHGKLEPAVRVRRFGLGQLLLSTINVWHAHAAQQIAGLMQVRDAESYGSLSPDRVGQALLRINGCYGLVWRCSISDPCWTAWALFRRSPHLFTGQFCVPRVGEQRHRRTSNGQAR